jgi:ADP-heptose:LPS heptosyltransferase
MSFLKDLNGKIEHYNRIFWYRLIGLFLQNERLDGKLDAGKISKVLFLRHDAIGDMIMSMPMFSLLKEINPNIEIHVLASPVNAGLLYNDPNVDKVIIYKGKMLRALGDLLKLRANKYDVIFSCLLTKITKNAILANVIGSKKTVKSSVFNSELRWVFFNKQTRLPLEKDSMWEKMAALVLDTIDRKNVKETITPYMAKNPDSEKAALAELDKLGFKSKKFLAINISTRNERNLWKEENYKALIEKFLKKHPHGRVLMLWMGDDEAQAQRIADAFKNNVKIYRRTNDIMEIVSVVENALAVLSPDTGVVHICSAVKTPVVGMYVGEGKPSVLWQPFGIPHRIVETDGKNYVATLPVTDIWNALDDLLTEIGADFS